MENLKLDDKVQILFDGIWVDGKVTGLIKKNDLEYNVTLNDDQQILIIKGISFFSNYSQKALIFLDPQLSLKNKLVICFSFSPAELKK